LGFYRRIISAPHGVIRGSTAAMSLAQYARFLATGGAVGALTVACRELIGWLLGADNPACYSISVLTAYAIGIVLSFIINRRYTFNDCDTLGIRSTFLRFLGVALSGLLLTWSFSLTIRYQTSWLIASGSYSGMAAFAVATLLASAVTYPLTALVVFRRGRRADEALRREAAGA
jgi:putative flippase GtrA